MQYLNLGCGHRYHPDWINIDIVSTGPGVIAHDLSQGIPLPDTSCDVVYHSHILEHFRRKDALQFIKECYRVLKPGGILRVATPDLERICRIYLERLEAILDGDAASVYDYEWIMLEMYDQTVRERNGGDMKDYLFREPLPNEQFIYERIGQEGRELMQILRTNPVTQSQSSWLGRLRRSFWPPSTFLNIVRDRLLASLVLSKTGNHALAIGRFRLSGEVHQWMYDRYSLAQLMVAAGFQNPIQQSAQSSLISGWTSYNLDTLPDGRINKPDSLFMEAIKPVRY